MVGHAAHHHRRHSFGTNGAVDHRRRPSTAREGKGRVSLWSLEFQFVFSCRYLVESPLAILKFDRRLIVKYHLSGAGVGRKVHHRQRWLRRGSRRSRNRYCRLWNLSLWWRTMSAREKKNRPG